MRGKRELGDRGRLEMDILKGDVRRIYFKYLAASFGSALISSIYGIVDMAMVGQYQGPEGTAALAVVAPVWNLIYSLGLLAGIGGSVLFSTRRGSGDGTGEENRYFTSAVIGAVLLSALAWAGILLFERPLLRFFGADESLLELAALYLRPVKAVLPLFLFNQLLAAFLRNDSAPGMAMIAVLSGGAFNVFGDYYFVFTLDMGIYGAGLATAIGSGISLLIMLTHFAGRRNTLRLVRPRGLGRRLAEIVQAGFSAFFIDVAMGILTVLFNRQIMRYLGTDALAIYGTIINISTFVQCCAYSVGQASQPIISMNFGAGQGARIRKTLHLALWTTAFFAAFWTVLSMACPELYIRIFMEPTPEILDMGPGIIRMYALSFILLPLNIFSTYYFQAIMKPAAAFAVSVARGLVISGVLIMCLPAAAGPQALWLAMPVTEVLTAAGTAVCMKKYTAALPQT